MTVSANAIKRSVQFGDLKGHPRIAIGIQKFRNGKKSTKQDKLASRANMSNQLKFIEHYQSH